MTDEAEGLRVPERIIPVPKSLSPEAQTFLSQDFGTAPPEILVSGTRDMPLSPTVMMHRALRCAGV